MNLVKASLKHRQVTFSILLLMFASGVWSLLNMPRREDPKIVIPGGLVVAYFPGANAIQVEEQVTRKLEEFIFQFEEVNKDKTYSVTSDGRVELHIWLQDKVRKPDIFWNKLRHQLMVIKALDLPPGVQGPFVNSDFGDTESMIIAIGDSSGNFTLMKEYALKLEDQLRQIPAVSKLKLTGEQKEQITVAFNSASLSKYDLNLQQVLRILQTQNIISASGEIKAQTLALPLHVSGAYTDLNDIREQIVGSSKSGAVIRLGEIASVTKGYAEPASRITVNGENAILLSIQMHEGRNIVKIGGEIDRKLAEFEKRVPGNMKVTTLVNQPQVVKTNVSEFLREFLLSIVAVILVVFLLLPLRIAAVAAAAIPMTVSITFALLHVFGLELNQVTLASMISVLGIVVDDAIIIADNYVELLDRGNDKWTAAWRSATDLVVPVLTATITIIASFLPLVILTGTVGEFIRGLPITVTIALTSSFIVAMVLTPLLCNIFIRTGLHTRNPETGNRRPSFLSLLQNAYNKSIDWCLRHKSLTITASFATVLLAGLLFRFGIREKFFPEAERNQFTVELWMPTGTRLEKTEEAILRIENSIKHDSRVISYATFTGTSAPRFYYNYSPQMPESHFAQMLINTSDPKATKTLSDELREKVNTLVPEGTGFVRLMMQGQPMNAKVEVRIAGEDINKLKEIGSEVSGILRSTPGSYMIRNDFREDSYGIRIRPKAEAARLGFTTLSISQMVYTSFSGYSPSSYYEEDNPVGIVLRLADKERHETSDLRDLYLQSPVTGASVPLRQIADLVPEWQPGRIIHRNGMRTLTVQSETGRGTLASELLKAVSPEVERLPLPQGYRIFFGGEYANQHETFGYMVIALILSLIIIFIVLLFQFRDLKETGLVMLTIPLSLFGAIVGLVITGNDFGFTAFCGLISLSGIEVRNAIILIDHTNELIKKGMDIPTAASEAGKRRLRPIFLTAMAAAIGVLPMILSGSPLWSPLASVIAFGVIWSMLISTLSIPVLYTVTIKPSDKKDISLNS